MPFFSCLLCPNFLAILVTLLIGIIAYFKWKLSHWDKRGLPNPGRPSFEMFLGRQSWGEYFSNAYKTFKEKGYRHGGVYLGLSPVYVPVDPEIVKLIMQTDFGHFMSHGGYVNEEDDPLTGHLFNLDDVKWRNLRVKMTPTFTSGKMKMMFHTITDVADNLKAQLDELVEKKEPVDSRDILGRFGTDVISSVAFGLECNSLKDPDVPFRFYGKKAVELPLLKIFLQVLLPFWVLKAIKHKFTRSDVETFFMKVIKDTVEYREKNNIYRKDFMHLLLQLKNRGTVTDDSQIMDETGESKEVALTMNQLAAQAYIFFMAGYETTSNTVSFALYELAVNPEIQQKVRAEIQNVLAKHGDKLTYESLMEMTYLDKVMHETLRKYPALPLFTRLCTKDYTIPGTNIQLKKGDGVIIPVLAIHTDPEYYPNPEIFDPERFTEENKASRPGFTWIPFGEGPRICIGMRFGLIQSKISLIAFVKNFDISLNPKTPNPLKIDKKAFVLKAEGAVWLDLKKLD